MGGRRHRKTCLEHAGLARRAGFEAHARAGTTDPVGRPGAAIEPQRLQFPALRRKHMDGAIAAHQNGQLQIFTAALLRRLENLFRLLQKWAHEILIVRVGEIVKDGW